MRFITYSNGICEKRYILTAQGQYWADRVYREPGTYSLVGSDSRIWNHHQTGSNDSLSSLESLAAHLGINLDSQSQQSINSAHAIFVSRRSDPRWYELNEGLHFAENILQQRTPMTSIDANSVRYEAVAQNSSHVIPLWWDSTIQPSSGLFAGFTRIGRWWEEIWRASDWQCPEAHHNTQLTFNGSAVLRFRDSQGQTSSASKEAEHRYSLMYGENPTVSWHDVQHGLYWLGELDSADSDVDWFKRPVQSVRLE